MRSARSAASMYEKGWIVSCESGLLTTAALLWISSCESGLLTTTAARLECSVARSFA